MLHLDGCLMTGLVTNDLVNPAMSNWAWRAALAANHSWPVSDPQKEHTPGQCVQWHVAEGFVQSEHV